MPGRIKRKAWRVRWADGRAVVCYATLPLAQKAAKVLHGTITYGPAIGRIRTATELPKGAR